MNISLLGNAIWGDNSSALDLDLATGAVSRLSVVGCLLEDYGTAAVPVHQSNFLPDVRSATAFRFICARTAADTVGASNRGPHQ
jgi:hypothetical protein